MIEHSIALCMIVRDEAQRLAACLSSVQGLVQEVWVVDTGSTDGTPEQAQQLGANVVHYPWSHDFAAARNAGLEKATTEWILVMDADEVLASEDIPAVISMLRSEEASITAGFFLQICSFLGDQAGPNREVSYNIRLFRNKVGHRYDGAVHEQILPAIERSSPTLKITELRARILHYGYMNEVFLEKQKPQRNLQIIRDSLHKTPDDYYLQYHAAVCLYNMGEMEEAVRYLYQVLEQAPHTLNYVARSLKIMVIILRRLGKRAEALAVLDKYQHLWPLYTDLLYLRAQLYNEQGNLGLALDVAHTCLRQGPAPPPYDSHDGVGTHRAAELVGDISFRLGNKMLAEQAYREIPIGNQTFLQSSARWLRLLSERLGENPAIMELLRRTPRPYDYLLLAEICALAGMPKNALGFVSADCSVNSAKQQLMRGRLLHQAGQLEEALQSFRQISRDKAEWAEACLWQAYCSLGLCSSAELLVVSSSWGVLHSENHRLIDTISFLIGGVTPTELALDLLVPILTAVAPHVPYTALERALGLMLMGDRSSDMPLQLALLLYNKYQQPELAWEAYRHRLAGVTDPWLETHLHGALGRPLPALHASLRALKSPTKTLPEDYIRVARAGLALYGR